MGRLQNATLGLIFALGCAGPSDKGCGSKQGPKQTEVQIDLERFRIELWPDDYALGSKEPLVTIVAFTDYACGPCGRSWKVLRNLVEDYGDRLRVVFRSYTVPGFLRGEEAVEAAFAAGGQGKFWDMHWRLFEDPGFDRPSLRLHAQEIGLDVEQFAQDLDAGKHASTRMRHRRQAVTFGIRGLPASFVNGVLMVGYQEEAMWHRLIDDELQRVGELLGEGVLRAKVYETIMQKAQVRRVVDTKEAKKLRTELEAKQMKREAAKRGMLNRPEPAKRYKVLAEGLTAQGPTDAPVLMVEFVDFQCPFCRQTAKEVLPKLRRQFSDDLRIAARHLPLAMHRAAKGAAKAAVAADRQGGFWKYHDRLLTYEGPMTREMFVQLAVEMGMDEKRFRTDLDRAEVDAIVERDIEYAHRLGVTATPSFFINGRYQRGFKQVGELASVIQEELDQAKKHMDKGIPRDQVLDTIMADAINQQEFPNP